MNLIRKFFKTRKSEHVVAFTNGKIIRIENIPDYGFSNKTIGDGISMEISSQYIYTHLVKEQYQSLQILNMLLL